MSQWNLQGAVAVVIGGTGVLGGAMAQGLAEAGASVAVLGRDHDRGHKRVVAIETAGGTGVFAACDATDKASLKAAHEEVVAALGPVNVLLNAAGGNQPQVTLNDDLDFAAIATDDWQRCFDLNLGAGALLPLPRIRLGHGRTRPGQHHQHRLGRRPPAGLAGGGVLSGQSGPY